MQTTRFRLVAVPAAVAAALLASIASPPHLRADPGIGGCVDAVGVSACANVGVPNINGVVNAIPNIPVPNINLPHVNPGMFRGR